MRGWGAMAGAALAVAAMDAALGEPGRRPFGGWNDFSDKRKPRHPSDAPHDRYAEQHDWHYAETYRHHYYLWRRNDSHVRDWRNHLDRLAQIASDARQAEVMRQMQRRDKRQKLFRRGKSRVKGMH